MRRVVARGNRERRGAAITGLWKSSFFVYGKVSINSRVLTINTVKIKISKNYDRKARCRLYFQVFLENNFIAAKKIKLGKNLLKNYISNLFLMQKKVL